MTSKVWFITGASRGFGRHWMLAALRRGDRVAAAARDIGPFKEVGDEFGDAVYPLRLDVTDRTAVVAAVAAVHDHFGRIDVVVNSAGFGAHGFAEEFSENEIRAEMDTNFFGTVWVTQAVLPHLRRQGSGHILQVTSAGGLVTAPERAVYCASKWALEGFTETLAEEVKPFGIRVTIVEPGYYATGYDAAVKQAAPLPAYADLREAMDRARAEMLGPPSDAAGTVEPVLAVVDAAEPPLRLLVGPGMLDLVKSVYRARLEELEAWYPVASEA
jgi:NAD(P)-dependent dehydrogenase (short-subunit alcohol dehydrogenase family)